MSFQPDLANAGSGSSSHGMSHESGSRRRKFAGYLKAANDLRQSYQQSYGLGGQNDGQTSEDGSGMPGEFPDLALVRHGDEEMVLFPSYAKLHHATKDRPPGVPGASQDIRGSEKSGDLDYWNKEWEKYEENTSVVDVDVRGWVYAPHRGPMTRKNKILVGLARHLSGVPAPLNGNRSRASSPSATHHERVKARAAKHDEELMEQEAEAIMRRGENEANIAERGGYSEGPSRVSNRSGDYELSLHSRTPSLGRKDPIPGQLSHGPTNVSFRSNQDDALGPGSLEKRASWNHPSDMSPAELAVANVNLMARLRPFLTTPLVGIPVTIFFYNNDSSKSRTVLTDESGHFSLRAALDFVPTNVRVLASEQLSATEEVRITESTGVSVISDIDDTIKHSAIGGGAKEIFRNAFIRELRDLYIEGVKDWYMKMAELGVNFHYVSNSPWQLYPVLVAFFTGAGLPKGSFHLKQYSGMLQGIFEPVAERKKGTLEKILCDFPKRRFLLVGDSGEADLELYTDLVLANPNRILGVFIRDVTTSEHQGFFDSSMGAVQRERSQTSLRGRQKDGGKVSPKIILADPEQRPTLPPRRQTRSISALASDSRSFMAEKPTKVEGESLPRIHRSKTDANLGKPDLTLTFGSKPPSRPTKPLSLRSRSSERSSAPGSNIPGKLPPTLPPKPRQYITSQDSTQPIEPSPLSQIQNTSSPRTQETSLERQSYRTAVKSKVAYAYNALPSWYSTQPQPSHPAVSQPAAPESTVRQPIPPSSSSTTATAANSSTKPPLPPSVPPRRNLSSYPAAAAHYATNRLSGGWSGYNSADAAAEDVNGNPTNPAVSKKVDLWNRRWARAQEVFEQQGVLLRSWRVGGDVVRDALALVEKAKREDQRSGRDEHGAGKTGEGKVR